ncbi:metal dependent phosphohydrolase [Denitrovibrio acetiphilus DSM 12809]|uniref:Metal dependent phosphohydrolase n=1 Tax=Denitrovibrio acetiphilus (strain DSM 12809 / NBRC 114555 / N2460) TaxID=522772 RepID=D4H643_DENA2|nr:HD domain-containing phosphohydrolase [Denitrovibrio acetiphilus]ADD67689.1 metal dependent phosphohydrolase [Denitrovibrio acetiphilus DSM 12809]
MSDVKTGINLRSIVNAISSTVDLVNDNVTRHHQRVAYISHMIGQEMHIGDVRGYDLIVAAAMHDIGTLSDQEVTCFLHNVIDENVEEHAEIGYLLLKDFKPLSKVANIIKYHHHQWNGGRGHVAHNEIVPFEGHIVHLADTIETLIDKEKHVLTQKHNLIEIVRSQSGSMFAPDAVDAFLRAFENDYSWLALDDINFRTLIDKEFGEERQELSLDELSQFSKIISYIIDFRSPYTASHSSGVAAVAYALGRLEGFGDEDCKLLKIAGYFHDLGKIAIQPEILEKEGKLSEAEYAVMRSHSYHTFRILSEIKGFEKVTEWASFHHERLDGSGYPFGLTGKSISKGAKILAVADVFSALIEERPYRTGMSVTEAQTVMEELAHANKLDKSLVDTLISNITDIYKIRKISQAKALEEYVKINKSDSKRTNGIVLSGEKSI